MADYAELVHLDKDTVQRVATAYTGYGIYLERAAEERRRAARFPEESNQGVPEKADEVAGLIHSAASSYNIAGSHFALVHAGAASLLYWAAARAYLRLGRLYGGVLAVCARDDIMLRAFSKLIIGHSYSPHEIPYAVITIAALAQGNAPEFRQELDGVIEAATPWRGAILSDIQIPVGLFLDLFKDVSSGRQDKIVRWPRSARLLMERFGEQLAAAQENSYRWKRMQERFLPIQPEVLASIILTRETFGEPDFADAGRESARFQQQAAPRILLGLSKEMIETGPSDSFRGFPSERMPESVSSLLRQWREHRG